MAISANDHYRHSPRMSRLRFQALLQQHANAGVLAENQADVYFDECVRQGIDPLFVLAIFNHESSMGRAGVAATSKSWGNTRAPNFGAQPIGDMPGLSGRFPIWATWLDGLKSTVARLMTDDWYYAFERRTIGEVFRDPHWPLQNVDRPARAPIPRTQPLEWAPAGDLNNPASYLAALLRFMNANTDVVPGVVGGTYPKPQMIDYPSPNRDGYGTPRTIQMIVNHIGDGSRSSNLSWLTNPASKASSNAYIDKLGRIYELVPIWSSPWTNGDLARPDLSNPLIAAIVNAGISPNTRSYTIEHEGFNGDRLTPEQIAANCEVTAWVASETGIELSRTTIVGHYQFDNVNRSYCPSFSDETWSQLIEGARGLLDPGRPIAAAVQRRHFEATGRSIVWGFKGYWERLETDGLAWQEYGFPETDEFRSAVDGVERTVQLFERGGLAWYPESARTPWEFRRLKRDELRLVEADARKKGLLPS